MTTATANCARTTNNNTACFKTMRTSWETITPAIAVKYLEANRRNRTFMEALKTRYAVDMSLNQWLESHEGIAFDVNGNLIDGQHRLQAIVDSKKTITMLVTRGVPTESVEVINRGKIRTLAHALQIMGYDHADSRTIAVARRMMFGGTNAFGRTNTVTDFCMRKFIDLNLEAIVFSVAHCKSNHGPAPVAGVVARAYYHSDLDRLARFPQAMIDAIPKDDLLPGDQSARLLRKAIEAQKHYAGGQGSAMLYRKAQNALSAYLQGRDVGVLRESQDDLFPLPPERNVETQ